MPLTIPRGRLVLPPGGAYWERVKNVRPGSLVGYWPLWETSGSVAQDLSGRINVGAYTGVGFNQVGTELLGNTGFETAGAGGADVWGTWTETAGDGALADEGTLVQAGSHAAKVTAGATANTKVAQAVTVIPGVTYTLTFWTRGDATNAGRYGVYDVTNSADVTAATATGVAGTTYAQVATSFTAPAGCVSARLDLWCPAANGGIAYYDTVSCFASSASGIGDGRNAPYFDGTNDYCDVYSAGLAADFNGAEGTLLVWAKVASAGVWADATARHLVRLLADASNYVFIQKSGTANTMGFFYGAGVVGKTVSYTMSPTGWFCAGVTWSKSGDAMNAYVGGAQVGATQTGLGVWAGALSATASTLGAASTVPAEVWSGGLAHCALYSRALAPSEIASLSRL